MFNRILSIIHSVDSLSMKKVVLIFPEPVSLETLGGLINFEASCFHEEYEEGSWMK